MRVRSFRWLSYASQDAFSISNRLRLHLQDCPRRVRLRWSLRSCVTDRIRRVLQQPLSHLTVKSAYVVELTHGGNVF